MDPRLITLAKISPKEYALKIKERNLFLINNLKMYEQYIGTTIPYGFDTVYGTFGCPHCNNDCPDCLWTKALNRVNRFNDGACFDVPFGSKDSLYSSTLEEIELHYGYALRIMYWNNSEYIEIISHNNILTQSHYDKCMSFLQGHIEWAELDCWGSEYVEEDNSIENWVKCHD